MSKQVWAKLVLNSTLSCLRTLVTWEVAKCGGRFAVWVQENSSSNVIVEWKLMEDKLLVGIKVIKNSMDRPSLQELYPIPDDLAKHIVESIT